MKKNNTNFDLLTKAQNKFDNNKICNIELKNGTIINALLIQEIKKELIGSSNKDIIVCVTKEGELRDITFDEINDIT